MKNTIAVSLIFKLTINSMKLDVLDSNAWLTLFRPIVNHRCEYLGRWFRKQYSINIQRKSAGNLLFSDWKRPENTENPSEKSCDRVRLPFMAGSEWNSLNPVTEFVLRNTLKPAGSGSDSSTWVHILVHRLTMQPFFIDFW